MQRVEFRIRKMRRSAKKDSFADTCTESAYTGGAYTHAVNGKKMRKARGTEMCITPNTECANPIAQQTRRNSVPGLGVALRSALWATASDEGVAAWPMRPEPGE